MKMIAMTVLINLAMAETLRENLLHKLVDQGETVSTLTDNVRSPYIFPKGARLTSDTHSLSFQDIETYLSTKRLEIRFGIQRRTGSLAKSLN